MICQRQNTTEEKNARWWDVHIVYTSGIFQFCQHHFRYNSRFWNSLLLSWASVCVHTDVTDTRTVVRMCGRTRQDVTFVSWHTNPPVISVAVWRLHCAHGSQFPAALSNLNSFQTELYVYLQQCRRPGEKWEDCATIVCYRTYTHWLCIVLFHVPIN